jgi:hypothetical protein
MASPKARSYDESEVRAILDRALRNSEGAPSGSDLSHEQLVELGAEIGLSRERIEHAALEVAESKSIAALEQRIIARRRRWLYHHLSLFIGVNGLLFLINFLTTPGQWWFLFALFSMLLPLAVHTRLGLSKHVSERALRREAARHPQRLRGAHSPSDRRVRVASEGEAVTHLTDEQIDSSEAPRQGSRRSGA